MIKQRYTQVDELEDMRANVINRFSDSRSAGGVSE